jgi:dephospho-CoA kinase
MKVIGLTGGIGTGKSTVGRLLAQRFGVPVIDADQVAREVVQPGSPGLAAVREAFGDEVLDPTGALDRGAMRQRILREPQARQRLESILHPLIAQGVRDRLDALRAQGAPAAIVEAALMVETGSYRGYDAVLVVSASPEVQVARVMARDHQSAEQARAMLATQLPLAAKEAVATAVIRNDGDLEALLTAVDAAWERVGPDAQ